MSAAARRLAPWLPSTAGPGRCGTSGTPTPPRTSRSASRGTCSRTATATGPTGSPSAACTGRSMSGRTPPVTLRGGFPSAPISPSRRTGTAASHCARAATTRGRVSKPTSRRKPRRNYAPPSGSCRYCRGAARPAKSRSRHGRSRSRSVARTSATPSRRGQRSTSAASAAGKPPSTKRRGLPTNPAAHGRSSRSAVRAR
jgi:hypothetical protein